MPLLSLKVLFVSVGGLLLLNPIEILPSFNGIVSAENRNSSAVADEFQPEKSNFTGYRAVIRHNEEFIAVGSRGKIDRIAVSGTLIESEIIDGEKFNCVLSSGNRIIVAGEQGTILISTDKGTFRKLNSGTDKNINSLVIFKERIFAGTNDGAILSGDGKDLFHKTYPAIKGSIVSLSARNTDCFGVTNAGEIIRTTDGINWDVFDFNQVYAGYYKPCYFTKILATEKSIAVAGKHDDGSPVLMFSTMGNVWSERSLIYTNESGLSSYLEEIPNDIFYSTQQDQYILACNNGKVMTIPSCSHCNKVFEVSPENLYGISGDESNILILGANDFFKLIHIDYLN